MSGRVESMSGMLRLGLDIGPHRHLRGLWHLGLVWLGGTLHSGTGQGADADFLGGRAVALV